MRARSAASRLYGCAFELATPAPPATLRAMRRRTGTTTSAARYIEQGWTEERCGECRGSGIAYAHRNRDPHMPIIGQERCRSCAGRGSTWRSPSGRPCAYPGGPWLAG